MKDLPDQSIDMILSDLPYCTANSHRWDCEIPLDKLWAEYQRLIKPRRAVVLTAQIPFSVTVAASNLPWLRYEWIWEKPQGTGFLHANRMPLKNHENILVFIGPSKGVGTPCYNPQMEVGTPYKTKGTVGKNMGMYTGGGGASARGERTALINTGTRHPKTVLRFGRDDEKVHPAQKPVALFEYLIRTYTHPGELVLDNCIGSGTTAVACLNTNRNFIGFEKDPAFHAQAITRLSRHALGDERSDIVNSPPLASLFGVECAPPSN